MAHVARIGRTEMNTRYCWGNLKERRHWKTQAWAEDDIKMHLNTRMSDERNWINLTKDKKSGGLL